jgi:hypothetical protein
MRTCSCLTRKGEMASCNENNREVKYFAHLYEESLDACQSYMISLYERLGLLYGEGLVDHIRYLVLYESDQRLTGVLIQLAGDEKVSMLPGCDFLRLWHVDLLGLIERTVCSCAGLVSQFAGELDVDLNFCVANVETVYGQDVGGDFRLLSTVLLKLGRSFPDAVKEVLGGLHGPFYHWRKTFLQLNAERTAQLKVSFSNMNLESLTLDAAVSDR